MCCDGEKGEWEKKEKGRARCKVQEEGGSNHLASTTLCTLTTYERKTQCNDPVTIPGYNLQGVTIPCPVAHTNDTTGRRAASLQVAGACRRPLPVLE